LILNGNREHHVAAGRWMLTDARWKLSIVEHNELATLLGAVVILSNFQV
jgi:hypothetical protein